MPEKGDFDRREKRRNTMFLVWSAPTTGSSRSRLIARELGIEDPDYVYSRLPRSPFSAPLRYVIQAVLTIQLLLKKRPRMVLVQSPPSFAVLTVAIFAHLTGIYFIVDAHSDAFQRSIWTRPRWLYRMVARRATATLVTDEYFQNRLKNWGATALVVRDPVTEHDSSTYPKNGRFQITVVNTFADDEPLQEVIQAAKKLPDVHFLVTGRVDSDHRFLVDQAPNNMAFTGFLPRDQYYGLLKSSQAVMSLTTRNHTLQCGACEALSLERPVITSSWPLLREYFSLGTVHVDNTPAGIQAGIEEMHANHTHYQAEIIRLRKLRLAEWRECVDAIGRLIDWPTGDTIFGDK